MNNNDYHINITNAQEVQECDECLTKGICTVNSTLTSLQEIILLHLKELAFYLVRLKDFGITNESLKEIVVYALFNILTNAEYDQEEFHDLMSKLTINISQSKILYEKFCLQNNINIESVKTYFKHSKVFSLTDAIKKGEKYFLKKSTSFTPKQKNLFDIMLFLVKSVGIKIIEAQRLEKNYDLAYYSVLSLLNTMNFNDFSEDNAKIEISKFIQVYHTIIKDVFDAQIERYGQISRVDVSFSTEEGKAILVSGSDFKKLENVLKAVEKTDINVYTHGIDMLMAHAFPKIRSYKNLKGHYGSGMESSMVDFASFPGAVLMTKGSLHKIEYLYRGRLFTLDPIAPLGVVKVKNDDYEPLIKSALEAKGFLSSTQKDPIKVGFSPQDVEEKINSIMNKVTTKEIKHLYIVGILNTPNEHKQYFDEFLNLIPKDCFTILLSHNKTGDNIYNPDSFSNYSLFYTIINAIKNRKPLNEIELSVFIPKCDKHTISNLLYLKLNGVKNVYTSKCPTSLINPALMGTIQEEYNIKEFTNAQKDLEDTLAQKVEGD